MIKLENVTKQYRMGKHTFDALKGINLTIEAGEMIAIVGPSGCGKTSTMNILGLLDRPTSGHYHLAGEEVSNLSGPQCAKLRNQRIGFVFQSFFLLARLNASQNAGLPLFYRGLNSKTINQRAQAMLAKVGLAEFALHRPSELSGGQKQRVAIARALVGEPDIILADEPTGALDTKTSKSVLDLLIRLNKEEGSTIIIVTHDLEVAKQCQRLVKVQDGLIINE